jgi:cytochrome c peroxidase
MRKRALWAGYIFFIAALFIFSSRQAHTVSSDDGNPEVPGITVQMLDQMTRLPGDLAALPDFSPGASRNEAEIELGKTLFFDTRLSGDRSLSCASCHDPAKGFADGKPRATGFAGKELLRHSPTVLNAAFNKYQFWDGRSRSLEEQALGPILSREEMNMVSGQQLIRRLNEVPEYRERFRKAFGRGPTLRSVARAISAFERTLITPDSPFDRYLDGDKNALSLEEKRGLILFIGKASCSQCHNGPNLTDNKFHSLGSYRPDDLGRYRVTRVKKDKGAFKTPTLRNIALTMPYMHDGSLKTLEEVIDHYDEGGGTARNKSDLILKLRLTQQEKSDLLAFLKTLTGKMPQVSMPQIPGGD